ncbi:Sec-independent protein translocase TatB [Nakamurella sp. GG22]
MFGLSWGQIGIIVLVGLFVLGPERIPTAVSFVTGGLRKARSMAEGAQAGLRHEIGPELDELRRQIADLQSLVNVQELHDLHPQRLISKNLLGDEFSGGLSGFLGAHGPSSVAPVVAFPAVDGPLPAVASTGPEGAGTAVGVPAH